jgi:hypothetical protein
MWRALVAATVLLVNAGVAIAFNVETHADMNDSALEASGVDEFLRSELGLSQGTESPFNGVSAKRWLRIGGEREDDWALAPFPGRFMNHFHDPLRPWDDAGLQLLPLTPRFTSSVVWMQSDGQGWSWAEARRFYHTALTAANPEAREQAWADTFRALGQIMHLVEDAGQPEHVRNDPHGLETVCRGLFATSCFGSFEYWVSSHPNSYDYSGASPFDPAILYESTGYAEAPVPIARLIDTDTYDGTNPETTTQAAIGIAEFTNANFFSEDTIHSGYPFPDVYALVPTDEVVLPDGASRQYYRKAEGEGIQVDPVAAAGVLDDVLVDLLYPPMLSVDEERVWEATAKLVVPRATEYAKGVLDYFFRTTLKFAADPNDSNAYLISNNGPEDLSGTFSLHADAANGARLPVPGAVWSLSIPGTQQCGSDVTCNRASVQAFGAAFNPPTNGTYTLVFHGQMGNEEWPSGDFGAIAAKVVEARPFLLSATATYQTAFGDRGWLRRRDSMPAFVYGVAINEQLMFLNGDGVFRSTDGGATFVDVSSTLVGEGISAGSVTYLGGGKLLAVSVYGDVTFYSTDLGETWTTSPLPQLQFVTDPAYVGAGEVLSRLSSFTPRGVADGMVSSFDGGASWSPVPLTVGGRRLQTCDANPPECGGSGLDDFGLGGPISWNQKEGEDRRLLAVARWRRLPPRPPPCEPPPQPECIFFPPPGHGFWCPPSDQPPKECPGSSAYTVESGVYKSTDGVHWNLVYPDVEAWGHSRFARALAQSADGTALLLRTAVDGFTVPLELLRSDDGGESWQAVDMPAGAGWSSNERLGLMWMGNAIDDPS